MHNVFEDLDNITDVDSILRLCENLQEINIWEEIYEFESLEKFTQLTSLEVKLCYEEDIFQLQEIVKRNPQMEKIRLSGDYEHYQLIDVILVIAQMNAIIDLSLDSDSIVLSRGIYCDDIRKRQEIRLAMTAFTSLKRIRFSIHLVKDDTLIFDIITSLPNITEVTFTGPMPETLILSAVTEKLKILRIQNNRKKLDNFIEDC